MRVWLGVLLSLGACSGDPAGDDDDDREGLEICDDGIDNNDNGKVDCDDTAYCGGLQCLTTTPGDDDDDDDDLPDLEVGYGGQPIGFTYTPQPEGCQDLVETITVINRSTTLAAEVDASCDQLGGQEIAMVWRVGDEAPKQFVTNEAIGPESQIELGLLFVCRVSQEFTTTCRVSIENEEGNDRVEFQVAGSPI
jgi:hypothetical protein